MRKFRGFHLRCYNKRNSFFAVTVFLLCLGIALSAGNLVKHAVHANSITSWSGQTVIIDAGHGGVDPGAIGVNGTDEKEINLQISLCLRDILLANGYNVVMIRNEDISIHDPKYKKISQIKTSDLKNRLKIIEQYPDAIAVSIHQNHFSQEQYHGAQMFYGRMNPESKKLAQSIQTAFQQNLQPDNSRQIKKSTSDVYIVNNAKNPIVLVECGFLSNWDECAKLCSTEYQQQAAFTIYCGIAEYQSLGSNNGDTQQGIAIPPEETSNTELPGAVEPPAEASAAPPEQEAVPQLPVEVWFVETPKSN